MQARTLSLAIVAVSAFSPATLADSILLGFNTQTPIQVYSTTGAYQQDFGPDGASAGIVEDGLLYVVQPNVNGTTSAVTALDATQTAISSFTVQDLIADGAPGANGTLWLAGYDGTVYNVTTSGQVLSSFNTGYTDIGIASNGSTLYTTEGNGGDGIDVRNTSGALLSTIHTGISTGLYGLGYDTGNSDFFAGSFDYVYQFSSSGALLNTFDLPGDSAAFPTPNGAVHDGLDVADLSQLITVGAPTAVPEPGSFWLILLVAAPVILYNLRRKLRWALPLCAFAGILPSANASVAVTINASADTVPVGTPISLSASASDTSSSAATFTYQYTVQAAGSTSFSLLKDFYSTSSFTWAPTAHEGVYTIQVNVRSSTGATGSAQVPISVTSRVTGSTPVISSTQNPLVALYSAPACSSPSQVRVRFKSASATIWQATPFQTCDGLSLNFLIAGMTAQTTYMMQQDQYHGPFDTPGPVLSFTTGSLPVSFPAASTLAGPAAPTSMSYPFILQMPTLYPYASDLSGNVVWYLAAYSPAYNPNEQGTILRNTNSGTVLGVQDDPNEPCPGTSDYCGNHQFLREFDLAGNIVRETNWTILNQEVNAMRATLPGSRGNFAVNLSWLSHDAFRLPNGDTAVIISDQQVRDQGNGPVLVDGDCVLVLDQNFYPVWFWDAFDAAADGQLDITRQALLADTCVLNPPTISVGCALPRVTQPNGQYYTVANDWTHCNSLTFDPSDNNLVLSSRHQAWVWKLSYTNGTGDGHIIWTLGYGGSFSLPSGLANDYSVWFDYQHDVKFQANGVLTLFDNNDIGNSATGANSHGQGWSLDVTNHVATPVFDVDLGVFAPVVGFASILSNGDYDFGAGTIINGNTNESFEYTPQGAVVYRQIVPISSYRPMRIPDLYTQQ